MRKSFLSLQPPRLWCSVTAPALANPTQQATRSSAHAEHSSRWILTIQQAITDLSPRTSSRLFGNLWGQLFFKCRVLTLGLHISGPGFAQALKGSQQTLQLELLFLLILIFIFGCPNASAFRGVLGYIKAKESNIYFPSELQVCCKTGYERRRC